MDIYRFTSKVYKRLKDERFSIRLKKLRGRHGECYIGEDLIHLCPDGEILATLVHEMLHDFNPTWSETKVLREERRIMNKLSHRQMSNLLLALGKALQ